MKKILTFLIVMFLFNINANAASSCSYQEQSELNSKAANVKVSYEVVEETIHFEDGDAIQKVFNIELLNVTEEFYVLVKNDITKEETKYYSSDAKDGIISFEWDYAESVTNFTFQVYTTEKTGCAGERFKTIYLTTPRYNEFSRYAVCDEFSDFYLCDEFVTFSKIERDEFLNQLDKYYNGEIDDEGEEPTEPIEIPITDKIFNFIDNYKWFIIGGLGTLLIILVIISRNRNKKQRELGL